MQFLPRPNSILSFACCLSFLVPLSLLFCFPLHAQSTAGKERRAESEPQPKSNLLFSFQFQVGEDPYTLEVEEISNHYFCEFKYGRVFALSTPVWTAITTSDDQGETWDSISLSNVDGSGPGTANSSFVTSTGALLATRPDGHIYRRSPSTEGYWSNLGLQITWLGTSGIDEYQGVVMAAEYVYSSVDYPIRVIRSRDDAQTWEVVMTKKGLGFPLEEREVDHFHTCQADPLTGIWYVSSGDHPNGRCRIWKTADQGDSWIEVTDPNPNSEIETEAGANLFHRYTDVWFGDNFMYWATDDRLLGAGAHLVRARKGEEPLTLEVLGRVSANDSRSAIPFEGLGHLLITENNTGYAGVELTLVAEDESIFPIGIMEGVEGYFASSFDGAESSGNLLEGVTSFSRARAPFPSNLSYRGTWKYTIQRVLRLSINPSQGGTIEIISEPSVESGWRYGDTAEIRAFPDDGYEIVGIRANEDLTAMPSAGDPLPFRVSEDTAFQGVFQALPRPAEISVVHNNGQSRITFLHQPDSGYMEGDIVQVLIEPSDFLSAVYLVGQDQNILQTLWAPAESQDWWSLSSPVVVSFVADADNVLSLNYSSPEELDLPAYGVVAGIALVLAFLVLFARITADGPTAASGKRRR